MHQAYVKIGNASFGKIKESYLDDAAHNGRDMGS